MPGLRRFLENAARIPRIPGQCSYQGAPSLGMSFLFRSVLLLFSISFPAYAVLSEDPRRRGVNALHQVR